MRFNITMLQYESYAAPMVERGSYASVAQMHAMDLLLIAETADNELSGCHWHSGSEAGAPTEPEWPVGIAIDLLVIKQNKSKAALGG